MIANINKNEVIQCFLIVLNAKSTEEVMNAEQYINQAKTQPSSFLSILLDILKEKDEEMNYYRGLKKFVATQLKNLIDKLLSEHKLSSNNIQLLLKEIIDILIYNLSPESGNILSKIISEILNLNQKDFSDNANGDNKGNKLIQFNIQLELSKYLNKIVRENNNQLNCLYNVTIILNKMIIAFRTYFIYHDNIDYDSVVRIQLDSIDYIAQLVCNTKLDDINYAILFKDIIIYLYSLITNLVHTNQSSLRIEIMQNHMPLIDIILNIYDLLNLSENYAINSLKQSTVQFLTLIIKTYSIEEIGLEKVIYFIHLTNESLIKTIKSGKDKLQQTNANSGGTLIYHLIIFLSKTLVIKSIKQKINNMKLMIFDLIIPILLSLHMSPIIAGKDAEEYFYEFQDMFSKQNCRNYQTATAILLSEIVKHYPEIAKYVSSLMFELLNYTLNYDTRERNKYPLLNDQDVILQMNRILSLSYHSVIDICLIILIIIRQNILLNRQFILSLREILLKHQKELFGYISSMTQLVICCFYEVYLGEIYDSDIHIDQISNGINYLIKLLLSNNSIIAVKLSSAVALCNVIKVKSISHIYTPLFQSSLINIIQSISIYSHEVILDLLSLLLSNKEITSIENQIVLINNIIARLMKDFETKDNIINHKNSIKKEVLSSHGLLMITYIITHYPYNENKDNDNKLENSFIPLMIKIAEDTNMDININEEVIHLSSLLMYKLKKNNYAYYALYPIVVNYISSNDEFTDFIFGYFNTLLFNAINESNNNQEIAEPLAFLVDLVSNHFSDSSKLTYTSLLICIEILLSYSHMVNNQLSLLISLIINLILKYKLNITPKKKLSIIDKSYFSLAIACLYSAIIHSPFEVINILKERQFHLNDLFIVTKIVYAYDKGLTTQIGKIYVLGLCSLINTVYKTIFIPEAIELVSTVLNRNHTNEVIEMNTIANDPLIQLRNEDEDKDSSEDSAEISEEAIQQDINAYDDMIDFFKDCVHLSVEAKDEYAVYSKTIQDVLLNEQYKEYISSLNPDIKEMIKKYLRSKRVPIIFNGQTYYMGRKIISLKKTSV